MVNRPYWHCGHWAIENVNKKKHQLNNNQQIKRHTFYTYIYKSQHKISNEYDFGAVFMRFLVFVWNFCLCHTHVRDRLRLCLQSEKFMGKYCFLFFVILTHNLCINCAYGTWACICMHYKTWMRLKLDHNSHLVLLLHRSFSSKNNFFSSFASFSKFDPKIDFKVSHAVKTG